MNRFFDIKASQGDIKSGISKYNIYLSLDINFFLLGLKSSSMLKFVILKPEDIEGFIIDINHISSCHYQKD